MMILILIPLILCALFFYLAYEAGFKSRDKDDIKYGVLFIAGAVMFLIISIGMFCDFSNRNNHQCRHHHHHCCQREY